MARKVGQNCGNCGWLQDRRYTPSGKLKKAAYKCAWPIPPQPDLPDCVTQSHEYRGNYHLD